MNENSYDVTVIIPVYNTEAFVEESILSVLSEKELNVELLLIDDGSTDGSAKIVDRYADQKASVKAFHQPNRALVLPETWAWRMLLENMSAIWIVMTITSRGN